jgi:hypothetical protein
LHSHELNSNIEQIMCLHGLGRELWLAYMQW